MKKVGIINYNCGNLASLCNSLEKIDCHFGYISSTKEFDLFDAYILPGVGSFKHGMDSLIETEMIGALLNEIQKGKDVLGICLGMQILFENSQEGGFVKGLGCISGSVNKIKVSDGCRVPHMGWNDLNGNDMDRIKLFKNIDSKASYYFVHSYCVTPSQKIKGVSTSYCGKNILAAFEHENIYGVQFHPEKSHDAGLRLLDNYCNKQL